MAKAKKEIEEAAPLPQLTFTEEEHKTLVDYLNMIQNKAKFDGMNQKDIYNLGQLYAKTAQLSHKIENHILEFKRITKAK